MSDNNIGSHESLRNDDECASDLPVRTNKLAVGRFIEKILYFLVNIHSDYLEALPFPYLKATKNDSKLECVLSQVEFKIFPPSVNLFESEDDTKILGELMEHINSRCEDVFEKDPHGKHSSFYKKLFCLLNFTSDDCSTLVEEPKHAKSKMSMACRTNSFGKSTCSLEQRVSDLELMLKQEVEKHREVVTKHDNERAEFRAKIIALEETLVRTEEALNDIATEYYSLSTEIEKKRKDAFFREMFQVNGSSTESQLPATSEGESRNEDLSDTQDRISTEESCSAAEQSLTSIPTNAIEREIYNIYKMLLLHISERLLQEDKVKLRNWAASNYSVEVSEDTCTYQILAELDKKRVITSSNLRVLRDFFEEIVRIDLVHIVECFLAGDYANLRNGQLGRNESKRKRAHVAASAQRRPPNVIARRDDRVRNGNQSTRANVAPSGNEEQPAATPKDQGTNENSSFSVGNGGNEQVTTGLARYQVVVNGSNHITDNPRSQGNEASEVQRVTPASRTQTQRNVNRQGYSSGASITTGDPWLCTHYKRGCFVRFNCCERFWPCHRCHNNKSTCGRRKLKSRDVVLIKCVSCQREQPFNEGSQFCCDCGVKFAEYFCARCKHLTGMDDAPYHCEKCGICRIHGDRSFHCDVCGVCLDVQLLNNHKCREGSAHDECCICLEDAFTGCQILPCSHKVHKECATQMIRSGITRCPICRESFAHKLERHPDTKLNRKHHEGNK